MTKEEEQTRNIPIRVPTGFLDVMDRLIAKGLFKSRSEFIVYAIRQYVEVILKREVYETKTLEPKKEQ